MGKLDLVRIERDFNSLKQKVKRKRPLIFILLSFLVLYVIFFGGAFLHESKPIQKYNIFPNWFGEKKVDIDFKPFPNVLINETIIPFYVTNTGDKDIEELNIYYSFCGLIENKAILNKNKLYKDEQLEFMIETSLILNTGCHVFTNQIWADIYEDEDRNCYLDVPDDITENYCSFCRVKFSIFLDGREQKEELWYPYLGESINTGAFMRRALIEYPVNITWVQNYSSQCRVLVPNTNKSLLTKKEKIGLGFFDTYTMCERGDDVEWCKEHYY